MPSTAKRPGKRVKHDLRLVLVMGALLSLLATGGCTGVRRRLGMEPEPMPPADLPTAAFSGTDRVFSPPGDADGTLERIVVRADAGAPVGDSAVLLDMAGPGVVRRIRLSLTSADPHWLRRVALAMYWDDEPEPSVHVPLGDFFGNGFERTPYGALPMGVSGDAFYAYLPMPFTRRARIVLENGTGLPVDGLAFDADVEREARLVEPIATLHARWSREPRPRADRRHRAMDVEGAGWFVGTTLSAQ